MIIMRKINNISEFGQAGGGIVGGTGPSIQTFESDAVNTAMSAVISLIFSGINPALLSLQFIMPLAMSYFGPSKRVYTTEDLQQMFNAIKEAYQAPYLAYSKSKQISPSISSESVYSNIYQNLSPTATNIDFSKYDINKNVWKLSGYNEKNELGYSKSRYMKYSGFGIRLSQN